MLKPDYATAEKLAKNYSVIPVCREILGDSTTQIASCSFLLLIKQKDS